MKKTNLVLALLPVLFALQTASANPTVLVECMDARPISDGGYSVTIETDRTRVLYARVSEGSWMGRDPIGKPTAVKLMPTGRNKRLYEGNGFRLAIQTVVEQPGMTNRANFWKRVTTGGIARDVTGELLCRLN